MVIWSVMTVDTGNG